MNKTILANSDEKTLIIALYSHTYAASYATAAILH